MNVQNTLYAKKIFLSLLFSGFVSGLCGQQTVKVLFIGNSFTYFQSMPENFRDLAAAAGKTAIIDEFTEDGGVFADDQNGPGYESYPQVYAKFRAQQWDYVVLQDNQGWFCANTVAATDKNANFRLRDSVLANSPCAKIIWFAGWGPKAGCYPGEGAQKAINRIDTNYQWLNNLDPSKKQIIAPLGKAWVSCMASNPGINLYNTGDYTHPNREGQFLNASVFFCTIFKEDPSGINFSGSLNGTISAANASILRNIAWKTVTTNYIYATHNLACITPTVSFTSGVLTAAAGYSSYQWYLNNAAIPGATSASYTPSSPGNYQVLCGQNGCNQYLSFAVLVTAVGVQENILNSTVTVYPNPFSEYTTIDLKNVQSSSGGLLSFHLYNVLGNEVMTHTDISAKELQVRENELPLGIYYYSVKRNSELIGAGKLIKQ